MDLVDLIPGREYKLANAGYGAHYPELQNGKTVTFKYTDRGYALVVSPSGREYSVRPRELAIVEITKAEIQAERDKLAKALELVTAKLDYMNESGSDIFNDNEFRSFQALKIAEDISKSRIDRARALAQLMR
jgi:hypothetical protein